MKRYNFKKRRENAPMIKDGNLIKSRAGGIKLEYDVYATDNLRIRIGKQHINIPYWWYRPMRLVFLKPLKDQWLKEKYKISKNHMGPKKGLFTNLWLILRNPEGNTDCYDDIVDVNKDYKDIRIKTMCVKQEHHQMIKYLDKQEERFSIPFVQLFF